MREHAPAKLNLALHVRARHDSWHAIETLFSFTAFGDVLEAHPSDRLSLEVEGEFAAAAGPLMDNLVLKAARLLGDRRNCRMVLTKNIPAAAGLGGGSADAAAALRLLNRFWNLGHCEARLEALAAQLGADVPACLRSRPCIGTNRGEVLEDVADYPLRGAPVLLVNPRVPVPTGPVFAAWDGVDRGPLDPAAAFRGEGRNDLESPAISLQPIIADVLSWLRAQPGARWPRMSGSGATCFALFETPQAARAAHAATPHGWWSAATNLL